MRSRMIAHSRLYMLFLTKYQGERMTYTEAEVLADALRAYVASSPDKTLNETAWQADEQKPGPSQGVWKQTLTRCEGAGSI